MRIPGTPYVQGKNSYGDADGKHYGIAIHNTSNDASDENEASYAKRRTDGVSSHLYCDDDSVTQSLSLTARAGHAGSNTGNNNSIAVEITGGNGKTRAWWLSNVAWDKLGRALAWIIKNDPDYKGFQVRRASVAEMKSNPRVKAFYGHDDMRRAWGGTTHTDPGPNFPWDRLFQAVNAALGGTGSQEDDVQLSDTVDLVQANDVQYSSNPPRTTVEGVLASTNYYVLQTRNRVLAQLTEIKANLAAMAGKDWVNEEAIVDGVLEGLSGADLSDEELADILRRGLGDRAAAVAAILAQPAG